MQINSSCSDHLFPDSNSDASAPVRSYARANEELAAAFDRYLLARGFALLTRTSYGESVQRFVESLGSRSVVEADRGVIREFLGKLCSRGIGQNTIRRHTASLRCFFGFLQLGGLTGRDPTVMLSHRKLPRRLPRVLTLKEVELLIAAGNSPLETAVAEFLYASGVRISELVAMRLEDMDFTKGVARVKKGKGGKDRIVLFGSEADAAIRRMIEWRSPEAGFLFEAPGHMAHLIKQDGSWYGGFYDKSMRSRRSTLTIGRVSDIPTRAEARRALDRILATTPNYKPRSARPYTTTHIRRLINQMGIRAGIGRVYPHSLRRAFASHMLQGGADLRVIQDLLGHEKVSTTALYVSLAIENLKEIHTRCHPSAEGNEHVEGK